MGHPIPIIGRRIQFGDGSGIVGRVVIIRELGWANFLTKEEDLDCIRISVSGELRLWNHLLPGAFNNNSQLGQSKRSRKVSLTIKPFDSFGRNFIQEEFCYCNWVVMFNILACLMTSWVKCSKELSPKQCLKKAKRLEIFSITSNSCCLE